MHLGHPTKENSKKINSVGLECSISHQGNVSMECLKMGNLMERAPFIEWIMKLYQVNGSMESTNPDNITSFFNCCFNRSMETEDYHFKFRIVLLGEKSVGKSTFLDVLANNFGKIVEQEVSDELNIKVSHFIYMFRLLVTWMTIRCIRSHIGRSQASTETPIHSSDFV
jgi:hypothetical protein